MAMQAGSPQLLLFVYNIRSGSGYTAATDASLAVNVVCKLQRMYSSSTHATIVLLQQN